ncbi:MAG: uroporphyrinogen-III C-methyltransferase [Alphaproteobacteria bacterium]|nr:uroporphyrinogen-III C-methyltransferase [Alphaproteobacteria bacterium]
MNGKVYLVGAGPGDPDLLTVKALRVIGSAQAVVYDRLVSDDILALIPHGCPRFFAGKSCKQKAMTQDEINALLVSLAQSGKDVVRLKGGDPFLFGRGGEEALKLAHAGIEFEIVPGITSAQGCGAYAGIPLTHRGLATGVRFLTGHRMAEEDALKLNWQSLADPETTLVVYMGLVNLEMIAQKLMEHGMPADLPAAAIQQGTTQKQNVLLTTLNKIAALAVEHKLEAPTLIVIGKVAALHEELQWFSDNKIVAESRYFSKNQ